ncbi:MAG: ATP-dependent Clp protease proteolytic subunit, partial [bacterium]|nr:ATP-dependent Clp protease proteolytic subunit [bacterium]
MMYLADSEEEIDIYINSPGGSVDAGMAIVDTIRACENKVTLNLYCIGMAASMGG